jgi:hypothetical protein
LPEQYHSRSIAVACKKHWLRCTLALKDMETLG